MKKKRGNQYRGRSRLLVMESFERGRKKKGNQYKRRSRLLVMKSSKRGRKKRDNQYKRRWRFCQRELSIVKCHYCGELSCIQVKCPKFKEDLKSLKELKGTSMLALENGAKFTRVEAWLCKGESKRRISTI